MKYALLNSLLGIILLVYGIRLSAAGWLLAWQGMCFVVVGIAYACGKASVFGKRPNGTLPFWSWAVFLPLHLSTQLVWHLIRVYSREPAFNQLQDDIVIGRRVLTHEFPKGISNVVDLTAEFQEPAGIADGRTYHSFPILDACVPDGDALRHFIASLRAGPLYVHCAQGHGRTALFTTALLMERKLCATLDEALTQVLKARPAARMNQKQQAFLKRLYGDAKPVIPKTIRSSQDASDLTMSSSIDFPKLWSHVITACPPHDSFSIHGPDHWRRVERNALILATRTGAKIHIVRLFAIFHDCRRLHDGWDPGHGRDGAKYAASLRGQMFNLSDEDFDLLSYACEWHTEGKHHADPTIGTCWDADRLDLGRAGMIPNPAYMSTEFGREIADHGDIHPWLHLAEPHLQDG